MSLLLIAGCLLAVVASGSRPVLAQGSDDGCTAADPAPTPTAVTVDSVPITVSSTVDDYFVLYAQHGETTELPVAVVRGQDGTTDLTERVTDLTADRYRVEKYAISAPGDVDGDCVDDLTELDDSVNHSPVNSAPKINAIDGTTILADVAAFNKLGGEVGIRFVVTNIETNLPGIYYINTYTHRLHESFLFLQAINLPKRGNRLGRLYYDPNAVGPNEETGFFYFSMEGWDLPVAKVETIYSLLAANLGPVDDNLYYHIANFDLPDNQAQLEHLRDTRVKLVFDHHIYPPVDFTSMNEGEAYGRLRSLDPDDRPHPRDIVIYDQLPNELSQVAGIVTTTPQTALAHVNLRAAQNGIPNAFIRQLRTDANFDAALIDNYVYFKVTGTDWTLRAATPGEVEAHYAAQTPATAQTPTRDLSVKVIKPLSQIGFNDWTAFGVKAANVAVLGQLDFPDGTVPDGYAIPFYFYDEFMKANDLYTDIEAMLADDDFQQDYDVQAAKLKEMRDKIKDGSSPQWIIDALETMHGHYPDGQTLRYRSSTNNEDLPSFNGAGLYDSKTQKPGETEDDGIDKSLKQVFASLWNFRAFSERELHNVAHLQTAMGVLVHPNYTDELANGVAVSFDPLYGRSGRYYVNTQLGEDLVTNPPAHSAPEEMLLRTDGTRNIISISNLIPSGDLLLSAEQSIQLAQHLTVIHNRFKALYRPSATESFAIEIEFKITSQDVLAIKQARTWVFSPNWGATPTTPAPVPTPTPVAAPTQVRPTNTRTDGGGFVPPGGGGNSTPPPNNQNSAPTPAELTSRAADQFEDVAPGAYYSAPVGWMLEHGITTGCEPTNFCPKQKISRQQFITLLWRAAGSPTPPQPGSDVFADIPAGSYADSAVGWAGHLRITNGCRPAADGQLGQFCPHEDVSRAQQAAFLYRYVGASAEPVTDFDDVGPNAYYARPVAWMVGHGITDGCSPTAFCSGQPATRAHAATFLYRIANRPEAWGENSLGILRGANSPN